MRQPCRPTSLSGSRLLLERFLLTLNDSLLPAGLDGPLIAAVHLLSQHRQGLAGSLVVHFRKLFYFFNTFVIRNIITLSDMTLWQLLHPFFTFLLVQPTFSVRKVGSVEREDSSNERISFVLLSVVFTMDNVVVLTSATKVKLHKKVVKNDFRFQR